MNRKDGFIVRDVKLLTDGLRNFADILKSTNQKEEIIIPEIMDKNDEEIICEEVTKTSRIILRRKK